MEGEAGPSNSMSPGNKQRGALKGNQAPIPVAVDKARTGEIASYYSTTATIAVEKEAEILARVSGLVESLFVEEGDQVKEDGTLLRIDNDEYSLRLKQAESKTRDLRARFNRLENMSRDLISIEEFETAKYELATAEAEEGLSRLNLSYMTVTAPFTGKVTKRLVDVGQNVSVDTPLFVFADFQPLLARIHVPSKEFKKLKTEQEVVLVLDSNGEQLHGRITLVSPTIDPKTGTIKVTVEVPDYPEATRPGDFAEVQVVTEKHHSTVLIPRAAVITDKGEQVVYVAKENVAERRVVEVGFTNNQDAEILSGIKAGESVVLKGQRSLKHGSFVKVLEDSLPSTGSTSQSGLSF